MNDPVGRCFSVKPRRGRPFCSFATSTEAIGLFPRAYGAGGNGGGDREAGDPGGNRPSCPPGSRVPPVRPVFPKARRGQGRDLFFGISSGGNPAVQKEEIREMRWLPGTEALRLVTYDNDRQVLEGAIAYLGRGKKGVNGAMENSNGKTACVSCSFPRRTRCPPRWMSG